MAVAPPHNFVLDTTSNPRKLNFTVDPNATQSVIEYEVGGTYQVLGVTTTSFIEVPDDLNGMHLTKGTSKGQEIWELFGAPEQVNY